MSFENSPTPLSMLTSAKSEFMHKLETLIADVPNEPVHADTTIYDGHAVIQMLPGPSSTTTYQDLAGHFLDYILQASGSSVIHVIFDRYFKKSIKQQTRDKRGSTGIIHKVKANVCAPHNWKGFLSEGENKTELVSYYTEYICSSRERLTHGRTVIISGGRGDTAVQISPDGIANVPDLESNQEEADTRIVLHAIFAVEKGSNVVVIRSPDTDVLLLLLHHCETIKSPEVYFHTDTKGKHVNHTRFIPVHAIHSALTVAERIYTAECILSIWL